MANPNEPNSDQSKFQTWLAGLLVAGSLITILIVGWKVISIKPAESLNVFNIIVPVVATWVGTVLAYYFSKENFAAATRSVTELAKFTTQEKLQAIPVIDEMIPRGNMYVEIISAANPDDKLLLIKMIDRQENAKKGLRIPILDEKDHPLKVIHRSTIDRYLTKRTLKGGDAKTIVLKELLDDPEYKPGLDNSFGVVARNATLAEVKAKLDESTYIQDVFITEKGKAQEAILGFITNTMVEKYTKVS